MMKHATNFWVIFIDVLRVNVVKNISIIFLTLNISHGQLNDLAKVDFTIIPKTDTSIEYTRFRGLFNYPVRLKKERYLFLGLDYSNIHLRIDRNNLPFNKEKLNDFQLLDLVIGYTKLLENDWRLGIRFIPGFSTNLTANALHIDDVVISGDIVFIKDKKRDKSIEKPYRLILGISYAGNRGFQFPLPFISYYKRFHQKWSYNIGIPKSNIQFRMSEKNRVKLYTELDGFTSNIQGNERLSETTEVTKSINMSLILAGLQYEYHFLDYVEFYARFSHIFSNEVNLRNDNKDNIFTLDDSLNFYFRVGISLKI